MEQVITRQKSSSIEAPVMETIESRRSKRAYRDEPVSQETIRILFEAARWAPSSMNEQPWRYIYATKNNDSDLFNRILSSLNESNRIWAKDAPLLIVSMTRKNFTRNEQPNYSAKYDLGGANAFLSLQATALDLNVHQMGGYNHDTLRSQLNIPDTFDLGVVMAIGYLGSPDQLPENLKQREVSARERYIQNEFVFNRSF